METKYIVMEFICFNKKSNLKNFLSAPSTKTDDAGSFASFSKPPARVISFDAI